MPAKLERCVEKIKAEGKSEQSAYAICNASMKDGAKCGTKFSDALIFDEATKTVVSVRDGIQEYLGSELGCEPYDKIFRVYRAKDTIAAIVDSLVGLPITDGHVQLTDEIADSVIIGGILDSVLMDTIDEVTNTTVSIRHKVMMDSLPASRELSLGYFADLVPCDLYDFEQVDIVPHHLAVVPNGRCGDVCTFKDQKGESEMKKKLRTALALLDADGEVSMQKVLELVADLPAAVKTLSLDKLAELAPLLEEIVATAKAGVAAEGEGADPAVSEEGAADPSAVLATPDEEMTPEEIAAAKAAEEAKTTDEEMTPEELAAEEEKKKQMATADAAVFKDAVAKATRQYALVVEKAKHFLPDTFTFADKSATQIMRAAVATQHSDRFTDKELSTAFKLLKKNNNYGKFGDSAATSLMSLADKEI